MKIVRPSMSNGCASAAITRSPSALAWDGPLGPTWSTANSSPPSRATVSPERSSLAMRTDTCCSKESPTAWPSVSFTSLKLSRSM